MPATTVARNAGRGPGEPPRAVRHVVATLLPLEFDLVEGEHREIAELARRDHAAVGESEERCGAAGQRVHRFLDDEQRRRPVRSG